MCVECDGGGCTHCSGDEGGRCALHPCKFCGKGDGSSFLFLSWGRVADGVAPYLCSVKHFWHDDGVVEVVREAAELGCIFLSFAEGVVGMLLEVEGLVEEDAEELVGCGWVDDVVY